MKIAIIGATGNVGSRLVSEALRRGHTVTGIARDPSKLKDHPHLIPVSGDADRPSQLSTLIAGNEVAVSSIMFLRSDMRKLIEAIRLSGASRYYVVGGAGSLEVSSGRLNVEQPDFPSFAKAEATRGKEYLSYLRTIDDIDWTMLSPSALFIAGERTGVFRLGHDQLLVGSDGKSWITYEDYAIALLDEIESPKHAKRRFTVGY
jgi:uncharacterized protein